jgi:hypothetical protein
VNTLPPLRTHWLHASGGLVWHWRALRYRNSLWKEFRQTVHGWLQVWQPPTDKLLIVGPSAGYTLDEAFLQRWREVVVLEPDPLARWLLRRRFPSIDWRFEDLDILHSDAPGMLDERFANHAVLFSNVLGQMTPRTANEARRWLLALRKNLGTHHWASYHDVISTKRAPDAPTNVLSSDATLDMTVDAVIAQFWRGGKIEVVDHCTFGLGEPGKRRGEYCVWPLRRGHFHLLEWLTSD